MFQIPAGAVSFRAKVTPEQIRKAKSGGAFADQNVATAAKKADELSHLTSLGIGSEAWLIDAVDKGQTPFQDQNPNPGIISVKTDASHTRGSIRTGSDGNFSSYNSSETKTKDGQTTETRKSMQRDSEAGVRRAKFTHLENGAVHQDVSLEYLEKTGEVLVEGWVLK